jgi:hypothetical protein
LCAFTPTERRGYSALVLQRAGFTARGKKERGKKERGKKERGKKERGKLAREDDVFFRPGVHLLTMRAGQLVILERRVRVEIFIDREACRRELRCGRASN